MLKTRGGETTEQPSSLLSNEVLKTRGGKTNEQSCRTARRKAKAVEISDTAAPGPLSVRAELASTGQGRPYFVPERRKAQKALSKEVSRAEQSVEERDALNERRRDHRAAEQSVDVLDALNALQIERRAGQSADVRDALNARRRANEQATISVRWHCALCTPVRLVVGVFPTNPY